ncbi:MAG: cbb3-type cytochrome c oxidase subunit 3 [Myxococcales bacterium]|nr:MAG: cbb3-type cytochrome c oxidase subunit 3 [Myxococcales bacterium]
MISWMAMEFFRKSPVLYLPMIALFLFMLVFVGIIIRTFWRRAADLDKLARMPLDEKEGVSHE